MQRNSISPAEREKYRNARSPLSSNNDIHAPDMKKIKREDKDGHVITFHSPLLFINNREGCNCLLNLK